jgi:hypothetical protein
MIGILRVYSIQKPDPGDKPRMREPTTSAVISYLDPMQGLICGLNQKKEDKEFYFP